METPNGMIMSSWKLLLGMVSMICFSALTVLSIIQLIPKYGDNALLIGVGLLVGAHAGSWAVGYGLGWYERGQRDGTTGENW